MKFSVASYSFHRLLAAGKQDMFQYILDSKDLGMSALDPWNGHLQPLIEEDNALKAGADWARETFSEAGLEYVSRVKAAADTAGLPFACLAVDGAHVYEPTPEARAKNRAAAYRWLDVAHRLGAAQMRMDSGGPAEMTDEMFDIIVEGYNAVISRAEALGIQIIMENHWGSSGVPENVVRIIEGVNGLALLFDTHNWAAGTQQQGWDLCAKYARSVHIKTFEFDENGNEPTVDIPKVIKMLIDTGYDDLWGIESVPRDGDEIGAVSKTVDLIKRSVAAAKEAVGK